MFKKGICQPTLNVLPQKKGDEKMMIGTVAMRFLHDKKKTPDNTAAPRQKLQAF